MAVDLTACEVRLTDIPQLHNTRVLRKQGICGYDDAVSLVTARRLGGCCDLITRDASVPESLEPVQDFVSELRKKWPRVRATNYVSVAIVASMSRLGVLASAH